MSLITEMSRVSNFRTRHDNFAEFSCCFIWALVADYGGSICKHRYIPDGSLVLYDTRETRMS